MLKIAAGCRPCRFPSFVDHIFFVIFSLLTIVSVRPRIEPLNLFTDILPVFLSFVQLSSLPTQATKTPMTQWNTDWNVLNGGVRLLETQVCARGTMGGGGSVDCSVHVRFMFGSFYVYSSIVRRFLFRIRYYIYCCIKAVLTTEWHTPFGWTVFLSCRSGRSLDWRRKCLALPETSSWR